MCPKDVRTDHMSRHFSTHVPQFISDMSEEQKAKHIETKNVIIQSPTGLKDIKPWCYCLVCKKIAYDEIKGQCAGAYMRYHKNCPCTKKWNKVQHLFNDGIVYTAASSTKNETKGVLYEENIQLKSDLRKLKKKLDDVVTELVLISYKCDKKESDRIDKLITFMYDDDEEEEEKPVEVEVEKPVEVEVEVEKPVEVPEPEPVIVPTKKVIRKATKAVGGHQAQEIT